ncbi:MAG: hypothetical protein HOV87_19785 [Catenulispora sp.]|nr:hypothetical protein [Catenulispora sp.]
MIQLDKDFLAEVGLERLPPNHLKLMLRYIYETLEQRVGIALAGRMSDEQLFAFEQFIDSDNEKGALEWLGSNFPDYKDVVQRELSGLKAELREQAKGLLEASVAVSMTSDEEPSPNLEPAT